MRKFKVSVDFNEVGYTKYVNIFGVIKLVLKESRHASVRVKEL